MAPEITSEECPHPFAVCYRSIPAVQLANYLEALQAYAREAVLLCEES